MRQSISSCRGATEGQQRGNRGPAGPSWDRPPQSSADLPRDVMREAAEVFPDPLRSITCTQCDAAWPVRGTGHQSGALSWSMIHSRSLIWTVWTEPDSGMTSGRSFWAPSELLVVVLLGCCSLTTSSTSPSVLACLLVLPPPQKGRGEENTDELRN